MLMKTIEDLIFRKGASQGIRHLNPPDLNSEDPLLRSLYEQLNEEFQLAPPVTIHASAPDLLAGYWHGAREAYVIGRAGRAKREVVAATVSSLNRCSYCETVHAGMFAAASGDNFEADRNLSLELVAARDWAAATLNPDSDALKHPRLSTEESKRCLATRPLRRPMA